MLLQRLASRERLVPRGEPEGDWCLCFWLMATREVCFIAGKASCCLAWETRGGNFSGICGDSFSVLPLVFLLFFFSVFSFFILLPFALLRLFLLLRFFPSFHLPPFLLFRLSRLFFLSSLSHAYILSLFIIFQYFVIYVSYTLLTSFSLFLYFFHLSFPFAVSSYVSSFL